MVKFWGREFSVSPYSLSALAVVPILSCSQRSRGAAGKVGSEGFSRVRTTWLVVEALAAEDNGLAAPESTPEKNARF